MTIEVKLTVEFDPARGTDILTEARKLFFERTGEHTIVEEDGSYRDADPDEVGPDDAVAGVIELVQCALEDNKTCERLGIAFNGTVCDAPELGGSIN